MGKKDGRFNVEPTKSGFYELRHPCILELEESYVTYPAFVYGTRPLVEAGVMVSPIFAQNAVNEVTAYPMREVRVKEDSEVAVAVSLPDVDSLQENVTEQIADVNVRIDELEE